MTKAPSRTPPERLREALAGSRQLGLGFDAAWSQAMRGMQLPSWGVREWRVVFAETREEWAAAYRREETLFSRAVGGRETLADGIADYIVGPEPVAA